MVTAWLARKAQGLNACGKPYNAGEDVTNITGISEQMGFPNFSLMVTM